MSWGKPTTAASVTLGCETNALSTSAVSHAVAGDVEHVVDAAGDPVVAVLVAAAAVTGEIETTATGEVHLFETFVLPVDRSR